MEWVPALDFVLAFDGFANGNAVFADSGKAKADSGKAKADSGKAKMEDSMRLANHERLEINIIQGAKHMCLARGSLLVVVSTFICFPCLLSENVRFTPIVLCNLHLEQTLDIPAKAENVIPVAITQCFHMTLEEAA
ncbi:hypothetical protein GBA52_011379 [Prunus armeniaca]|nr:hypothetical protein GBA52_011379 [Prunus armeniaca]